MSFKINKFLMLVSLISIPVTQAYSVTLDAVYDPLTKAPKCESIGSGCRSTSVNGRAQSTGGVELNQPNSINNSCADGRSGTYHVDESIDALSITTLDGTNLAPGKIVRIDATIWPLSSYTSDRLDLYYATNTS